MRRKAGPGTGNEDDRVVAHAGEPVGSARVGGGLSDATVVRLVQFVVFGAFDFAVIAILSGRLEPHDLLYLTGVAAWVAAVGCQGYGVVHEQYGARRLALLLFLVGLAAQVASLWSPPPAAAK